MQGSEYRTDGVSSSREVCGYVISEPDLHRDTRVPAVQTRGARIERPLRGYSGVVNSEVDTASALPEWATAVALELGLESAVGDRSSADTIGWLTSHVVDGVDPAAAPMTAFLVGVAAGRADDPAVAARDYVEKVTHLADGWTGDDERAEPAGDQSARA